MTNPLRHARLHSLAVALLSASIAACSESPTQSINVLERLSVSAQVSRTAFRSGDSTTVRVVVTNISKQTVTTGLLDSCIPLFDVFKDDYIVAPGGWSRVCTASIRMETIAPGASKVLTYVWRGENIDWAVMLSPGTYVLRGKLGAGDNVIHGEPVALQIL
ncbi:MAG: hypothetical protein H7Z40_05270 [Phycisphaerae bacterium]|nr:hypothetical protein [Gemmatimonadaceae bacterium]